MRSTSRKGESISVASGGGSVSSVAGSSGSGAELEQPSPVDADGPAFNQRIDDGGEGGGGGGGRSDPVSKFVRGLRFQEQGVGVGGPETSKHTLHQKVLD